MLKDKYKRDKRHISFLQVKPINFEPIVPNGGIPTDYYTKKQNFTGHKNMIISCTNRLFLYARDIYNVTDIQPSFT